jgi:hypothetical protein
MNDKSSLVEYEGLNIRLDEKGSPWMTQRQIGEWLGLDQSTVSRIVRSAIENEAVHEVSEQYKISVYAKNTYTARDGKNYRVNYYNMFVLIMVAMRANKSDQAIRFQVWALRILGEPMVSDLKRYLADAKSDWEDLQELYLEIQSDLVTV